MIIMKRYIYFTAVIMTCLLGVTCLSSCLNNDDDVDVVKNVILEVDSHPCAVYPIPSGIIELPLPGMKIKEENSKEWQNKSQYAIEGFTFEPGYFYTLKVKKTILANPPADSGNVRYQLVEVLKKEKDPSYIPDSNPDSTINSEQDIEYQDLCPINKYCIGRDDKFIVDKNGEITYSNGSSLPSYDKYATIYIENVLDKEDPNWLKFQEVPYMARYTYVLSPINDEIRLLPINHSDLLFKDVIPQNEFDSIRDNLESGEELHYALVLVNVHKKAIQKLEFTIKKK